MPYRGYTDYSEDEREAFDIMSDIILEGNRVYDTSLDIAEACINELVDKGFVIKKEKPE